MKAYKDIKATIFDIQPFSIHDGPGKFGRLCFLKRLPAALSVVP